MSEKLYGRIENPLTEALGAITGKEPPEYTHGIYSGSELGDSVLELQDWCSLNARPEWSTGIGTLEAAELIVREAVSNANIEPKEKEYPGVYVLTSFFIKKNKSLDIGHTMLWETMQTALDYIERLKSGLDDRPFEHRWNYMVLEKVTYGPYNRSEQICWWKWEVSNDYVDYNVVELDESPIPPLKTGDGINPIYG